MRLAHGLLPTSRNTLKRGGANMLEYLYEMTRSGTVIGLFIEVVPITCLVGILYAVFRCIIIKKQELSVIWGTEIIRWLFICYLTGLVNLILVPSNLWTYIWFYLRNGYSGCELEPLFSGGFNLIPTFIKVLTGEFSVGRWVRTKLAGNFFMFVPLGFFLPFVSEKIDKKNILKISVIVPIVIEVIQITVGRSFDVDDVILNFAGIVVGYWISVGIKAGLKIK